MCEEKQKSHPKNHFSAYILLVLATLIWGGSWPLGRWLVSEEIGGETIPPLIIGVIRYFIVIIAFFFLLMKNEGSLGLNNAKKYWEQLTLMGLTSVTIYQFGYLMGEYYTAASDASLIVATNPIWVLILSGLFLNENFTWKKIIGVTLAFTGVTLVVGFSPNVNVPNRILGDLFILMAALGYAAYTVIYKKFMNNFSEKKMTQPSSLFVITWVSFIGFLTFTPVAFLLSPQYINLSLFLQVPDRLWIGILYLSLLSTIAAYWFYLEGVKQLNASQASIFINLVPIFGVTFSFIFLSEKIDPIIHLTALGLIILGVTFVNTKENN